MNKQLVAGGLLMLALSACATKRYPIATELSPAQAELMTCRELALQEAELEQVQSQITDTATTDWRSVAGFLGDYGIGNAMAKSEAEQALSERRMSIRQAQVRKSCQTFSTAMPVSDEPQAIPASATSQPAGPKPVMDGEISEDEVGS